jgi:Cu2+-exporting ATPase
MSHPKPKEASSPAMTYKHVAIEGMSCAACATGVKRILEKQDGIHSADIQLANHTARIGYTSDSVDWEAIARKLQSAGYGWVQSERSAESTATELLRNELKKTSKNTLLAAALGLPLMAIGMIWMHTEWARWVMPALATPIMLIPGRRFFVKAIAQIRTATWGMDSLVALSCTTAYGYSMWNTLFPELQRGMGITPHVYYEGIGAIIGFLLLGRWLEGRARLKATEGLGELLSDQPSVALCWRNNAWTGVAVASLQVDDRVFIQAGARVPVDGYVVAGRADIDESWLTGEPFPVSRGRGDEVRAGGQTIAGNLEVVVARQGSETLQAQIIQQIREAQAARAPIQDKVDQITQWFVPGVVALAFISASLWWIFAEENAFSMGLLAFVNTLIIACPCALGLATPTALVAAVSSATRWGILVRDASVWEKAGQINVLLCDKTGTLTSGQPIVRSIRWSPSIAPDRQRYLLELWQKSAQHSSHPVARALIHYEVEGVDIGSIADKDSVSISNELRTHPGLNMSDIEEHVGLGLSFRVDDTDYRSGRWSFVAESKAETRQLGANPMPYDTFSDINNTAKMEESDVIPKALRHQNQDDWRDWIQHQAAASAELWLGSGGEPLACALVDDLMRKDAFDFVESMKNRGIETILLSGDRSERVAAVAHELGIICFKGDLLPGEKLAEVRSWQSKNKSVAMLGDGLNDAGALAAADLGMAMGAGSALSKHQSGLVAIRNDLSALTRFFDLAKRTHGILRQNLIWAFAYNVIGLPVAMGLLYPIFGILMHPSLAAAAMAFSSVSVVGNSIRLLKFQS